MTNFLNRMAARAIGAAPVARPFVPARFSPATGLAKGGVAEHAAPDENAIVEVVPDPVGKSVTHERPIVATSLDDGRETLASSVTAKDLSSVAVPETTSVEGNRDRSLPSLTEPALLDAVHSASSLESSLPITDVADQTWPISLQPDQKVIEGKRLIDDTRPLPPLSGPASRPAGSALPIPWTMAGNSRAVHSRRDQSGEFNSEAPIIRVSIGRIDVRAQFPAAPSPSPARTPRPAALSLDEYLRQRREGKR
jgi:hypothetical protein